MRDIDKQETNDAVRTVCDPGQVTELRALGVATHDYRTPHVESGYFDDPAALADAAVGLSENAQGIYIVPNPINPALLARSKNRVRPARNNSLTTDRDIVGRRWLLIDADPKRPAGISSTDEEHVAAIVRVYDIRDALGEDGWPDPIIADSGNGAHLLYRIDLPTDDGGLAEKVLISLAFRFNDEAVEIDQTVHNPARIWKLYGTYARKGDSTPERPHRRARILEVPEV